MYLETSVKLDIPPRLQWENSNGYCGETSTQMCGLYYGNYISQKPGRQAAGSQLLIGQNDEKAFKKLKFTYESFDNEQDKPQITAYLQWIKKHLNKGSPVIVTGYEPQGKNDEYDHIYLAVGYEAESLNEYSDDDKLIYITCFSEDYTVTPFGQIYDDRSMSKNGANIQFAFPEDLNYGVAITGIQDPNDQFYPVRLKLFNNKQPNVSLGQKPVQFQAQITVSDLEPGNKYCLLRFNKPENVPTSKVDVKLANQVHQFVAKGDKYVTKDKFMSNATVFYRCIEEGQE